MLWRIAASALNRDGLYLQTIYFPLAEYAKQRGRRALDVRVDSPQYKPDEGRHRLRHQRDVGSRLGGGQDLDAVEGDGGARGPRELPLQAAVVDAEDLGRLQKPVLAAPCTKAFHPFLAVPSFLRRPMEHRYALKAASSGSP